MGMFTYGGYSVYRNFFEEGRDAAYFGTTIIDDDNDPGEYSFTFGPNRPLPEGLYKVEYTYQYPCSRLATDVICNQPQRANTLIYEVTVEAPLPARSTRRSSTR